MRMPHQMRSPDALRGVIEAFVTHEGTDDGLQDVARDTQICQVQQQFDEGGELADGQRGGQGPAVLDNPAPSSDHSSE